MTEKLLREIAIMRMVLNIGSLLSLATGLLVFLPYLLITLVEGPQGDLFSFIFVLLTSAMLTTAFTGVGIYIPVKKYLIMRELRDFNDE